MAYETLHISVVFVRFCDVF